MPAVYDNPDTTPKELAKRLRRGEQWELAMPFPTDQERERFEAHYGIKWTEIQTLPISSGTRIHSENAYKRHAATWMAAKAALSAPEPADPAATPTEPMLPLPDHAILTLEGGFQVPITRSGDGYVCDWLKAPRAPEPAAQGEAIGEVRENGVTWFRDNPHAYPIGTRFYTAPPAQPAVPEIHISCETESNGIKGSTSLRVIRVNPEDDGSFTAVTDHWPQPAERVKQADDAIFVGTPWEQRKRKQPAERARFEAWHDQRWPEPDNCRHKVDWRSAKHAKWTVWQAAHADMAGEVRKLVEAATELRQRQRDYLQATRRERNGAAGHLVGVAGERLDAALAKFTQYREPSK